jgi:hypothetical protein
MRGRGISGVTHEWRADALIRIGGAAPRRAGRRTRPAASGWGRSPRSPTGEAQTPAWLHAALGDDKELRARALLGTLSGLMPGALVLRSTGRLYPGEALPRWNLGLLRRRDGEPLWNGPPDPLLAAEPVPAGPPDIAAFASALAEAFASQHWAPNALKPPRKEGEEDADKEGADHAPAWTVTATAHADAAALCRARPTAATVCPARLRGQGRAGCRPRRPAPPSTCPRSPASTRCSRRPALHRARRAGLWLARAGVCRRHPAGGRHAGAHHRHARPRRD